MCLFLKNILYLQSQSEGFCSFLPKESGRSSVRLEYTSGGRVVAGSNPVTPTDEKSLIFNRISRIFLLWYIVRKMAVVHKWYINGRYPKISISVVKYLVVGRLLYLGLYSRSEQADNEFYRVRGYMSCNRAVVSSVPTKQNDLPICFWQVLQIYSADVPISNRIEMSVSASFASVPQPQTIFTCGANSWMTVKRLHRSSKLISDAG